MEAISIFDIFKVGVGPSSSHTLGPWKAALDFRKRIEQNPDVVSVSVYLFGSLSKTGKGHATDYAVELGLLGYDPETIDTDLIEEYIKTLEEEKTIKIGSRIIRFDPIKDVVFTNEVREIHPNTLEFFASDLTGNTFHETYLSVGGGFIERVGDENVGTSEVDFPYPIDTALDLSNHIEELGAVSISDVVLANEKSLRTEKEVFDKIDYIYGAMRDCVMRGFHREGILPGGLNVRRRAKYMVNLLTGDSKAMHFDDLVDYFKKQEHTFTFVNNWVSAFALSVNEENAALGRVVTSPTNGAAGVIPAVWFYYYFFCDKKYDNDRHRFFLTAGVIGSLFKKGATISAAVGGCQAEIGVSSAMAAGALTEVLGGTHEQVLMAAEIAMEHHLGLTCDPVGGLVQVPCIERNTMGAMKAITAANLAISGDPSGSVVNLDSVIKSMWDTAQAMNSRFKETSEGGLAIHISVAQPEC